MLGQGVSRAWPACETIDRGKLGPIKRDRERLSPWAPPEKAPFPLGAPIPKACAALLIGVTGGEIIFCVYAHDARHRGNVHACVPRPCGCARAHHGCGLLPGVRAHVHAFPGPHVHGCGGLCRGCARGCAPRPCGCAHHPGGCGSLPRAHAYVHVCLYP